MPRVLIVDDERSIRRTLGEFLREDGYEVVEAEDADVALKSLQKAEFDVVVTDIILPRVSGVELLRRIQAVAPDVQVVMMTGEPTVETATESLRAGAADYLFKPIDKQAILRSVAKAARLKSLEETRKKLEAENESNRENLEKLVEKRTAQLRASEAQARDLLRFNQSTLDALPAHICVLDERGTILAVNQSWRPFAESCPPPANKADVGANYLELCDAVRGEPEAAAQAVTRGLRSLMQGRLREFSLEYPTSGAGEKHWFLLTATPFGGEGPLRIVVALMNITARKQAETDLQRNHEQYRRAIEAANAIPYQTDYTTRQYTFISERIKNLTGYSASELYPAFWKELILETVFMGDAAGLTTEEASRKAIAGELKNWCADHRIRARDGTIRWISDASVPILNNEGEYVGSLGILQEITERKRAEEDLRKERTLLRTLVDHLPVAVYVKDTSGRITLANPMAPRNFGLPTGSDALGKTDFDFFPREQAEHFWQDDLQVMRTGQPLLNHNEFITRRDGSTAWLLTSKAPLVDATGRVTGLVGIGMEITELRNAMDQLHKLARAVEQSPTSIVICNRDGNIEFVNPKFTKITGYTAEEVVGKSPKILKSGETPAEEYRRLWETISAGQEWHGEFHNKRKDGTLFWERASISPIRDAGGKITHFIAVKEDVTEQKNTQAKLLRAQRVESIGSLASGIAHDLNNILTPIIMCAPMLQWDNTPENRRELAQTIELSAERAAGVIKQLLSFARGKDAKKQPVQMRHMVRDMAKLARETFPRSILIEDVCPADLWPVLADPTQLHQVILNLCVNARDAMPAGGKLILRAQNVTLDDHYVSMFKDATPGPFVHFQVEDTGIGIPDDIRDHIFESFFTTKGEDKGTGLGLTTVLGIVRDHKGFINFTTKLGKGTTFDVYLPASPAATTKAEQTRSGSRLPQGQGELILVVDDEPAICETTQRTLERQGYRVLGAHNGIEALAQFSNNKNEVKAVVTDFMMPLMDGVTLCRSLRALSPGTPLIVSSGGLFGKPGGDALRAFAELKIQHVLNKPHTAEVLLQALSEELHTPQPADSAG